MPPVTCVESLHGVFHGRGAKRGSGAQYGEGDPFWAWPQITGDQDSEQCRSRGLWVLQDPTIAPAFSQIES